MCDWRIAPAEAIPDELKPSLSNVIITQSDRYGIPHHVLTECGTTVSPEVLSWYITFIVARGLNAFWTVDGKPYWIGTKEFCDALDANFNSKKI